MMTLAPPKVSMTPPPPPPSVPVQFTTTSVVPSPVVYLPQTSVVTLPSTVIVGGPRCASLGHAADGLGRARAGDALTASAGPHTPVRNVRAGRARHDHHHRVGADGLPDGQLPVLLHLRKRPGVCAADRVQLRAVRECLPRVILCVECSLVLC